MKRYNKIKSIFKAIILDLLFWVYIFGCLCFLAYRWFNFRIDNKFIGLGVFIFTILFFFIGNSLGRKAFFPSRRTIHKWFKSFWGWFIVTGLLVTFVVGWNLVEVDFIKFFMQFKNAGGIMSGIFDPNFDILTMSLTALAETIYLALLATVFAIPFAFVLSFFAARNLMPKTFIGNTVYVIVRTIATIFRSIEALVWAIIFSVWVGIGPFAGMLALMIHSIAALTKLYSEQIENIDTGPVEAIKATGASTLQTWIYAIIPQIISPYLAFTIYRWDINVRMATIVGFVGGGGIGLLLLQQQQLLRWHNVGILIWLIALVVWIMDMLSAKIRAKLTET
ncbi:MAG: phosphonate ABC transporter, permease protein PhnE [Candidatus Cloacimonadota bacterium]|nr:phosphonate ABC transporter, permease protein PhnE [Candidatus Cloacimonadota bacterium]